MRGFLKGMCMALVFMLLLSLGLIGCSENGEPKPIDQQTSVNQQNSVDQSSAETKLEPAKLIWYALLPQQRDQDMVFAEVNKYLKEKINTEVDIRALDFGNYNDKMKTVIAANDNFDMMWIADWMVGYSDMAQKGVLAPIDELLVNHAPQTKAFINDKFWEFTKVNGKLYGVPCYQIFYRQSAMWFKKELADKYGFDPSTIKSCTDIEPFLKSVKEGEKDITPIAANSGYLWSFDPGWVPGNTTRIKAVSTGNQVYVSETDPTKVFSDVLDSPFAENMLTTLKFARDWYNKGYVRKDLFSIQDLTAEEKAGKFACGFTTYKPGVEAEIADGYGFEVYVTPIGKPHLSGVTATLQAISSTSKNPERAMMLIELLNNDKYLFNLVANGIEGKHYIKDGENSIKRVEDNGYQPNVDWAIGNTTLAYLIPGKPDNINELVKKGNDEAIPDIMPDYVFNPEPVKNEIAACQAVYDELSNPLWAGVIDPDKYFGTFQEKVRQAGLLKIKEEAQKQVDAYWQAKK